MTDLRAALIEAGAEALDGRPLADLDGAASAVLDAFLDVLVDRADETVQIERKGWRTPHRMADIYADELIAVLRGDTDDS